MRTEKIKTLTQYDLRVSRGLEGSRRQRELRRREFGGFDYLTGLPVDHSEDEWTAIKDKVLASGGFSKWSHGELFLFDKHLRMQYEIYYRDGPVRRVDHTYAESNQVLEALEEDTTDGEDTLHLFKSGYVTEASKYEKAIFECAKLLEGVDIPFAMEIWIDMMGYVLSKVPENQREPALDYCCMRVLACAMERNKIEAEKKGSA